MRSRRSTGRSTPSAGATVLHALARYGRRLAADSRVRAQTERIRFMREPGLDLAEAGIVNAALGHRQVMRMFDYAVLDEEARLRRLADERAEAAGLLAAPPFVSSRRSPRHQGGLSWTP